MATEHITVVDPDQGAGYDYVSLSAWEADFGDTTGNLPSDDMIAVAKCRCTGGTADVVVSIEGWTVDSTRYIKIWTDPEEGYRHNGTYQTGNKYRIANSTDWVDALYSAVGYIQIIGIQVYLGSSAASGIKISQEIGAALIDKCLITGSTGDKGIFVRSDCVRNCIIYNLTIGITVDSWYMGPLYNNTVIGCGTGYSCAAPANLVGKNNVAYGCTTGYANAASWAAASTCNASDSADSGDIPGSNPQVSVDSGEFNNYAGNDFHLAADSSILKNNGADLSGVFADDIDSQTRSDWDIGADEYVAAGSVLSLVGSRIANASRSWQAAEDADVSDWNKSNPIIISAMIERT